MIQLVTISFLPRKKYIREFLLVFLEKTFILSKFLYRVLVGYFMGYFYTVQISRIVFVYTELLCHPRGRRGAGDLRGGRARGAGAALDVCMYVYIYIYIHIHIHTYIHITHKTLGYNYYCYYYYYYYCCYCYCYCYYYYYYY